MGLCTHSNVYKVSSVNRGECGVYRPTPLCVAHFELHKKVSNCFFGDVVRLGGGGGGLMVHVSGGRGFVWGFREGWGDLSSGLSQPLGKSCWAGKCPGWRGEGHRWSLQLCSLSTGGSGTKGPKVYHGNIPHTITPPTPAAWTVETRQDGSMLSCSLHQILTLPSECCSRNRDSSVWSSTPIANLLQHSTRYAFRDGILYTLVVMSGWVTVAFLSSLTGLPILLWPLTSTRYFRLLTTLSSPFTGYFLVFGPFSVNPRDGCVWKSQ